MSYKCDCRADIVVECAAERLDTGLGVALLQTSDTGGEPFGQDYGILYFA